MKFSLAIAAAAFAAGAVAYPGEKGGMPTGNYTVVTETLTALTTYCPGPTTITHGQSTYTVTEATTLTITNCPCTRTSTIPAPPPATSSPAPAPPAPTTPAPAPPAPTPYPNGTATVAPTSAPAGTGSITASAPISTFTGAAAKYVGSGALAGLAGLAMMVL